MNQKKKNYYTIKQILTLFDNKENYIIVITHINNMDSFQMNLIEQYCKLYNIDKMVIKLNLIKKLTNNILFLNLLAGPTCVFVFKNFKHYLDFFKMESFFTKIIPLAVYWNNNFYTNSFFFNYVKNIKYLEKKQQQNNLIYNLSSYLKFIFVFKNILNILFYILNNQKKKLLNKN